MKSVGFPKDILGNEGKNHLDYSREISIFEYSIRHSMNYTALDTQFLSREVDLNHLIQAKKDIQNKMLPQVTQAETMQLAMDRLPDSLVSKVKAIGKSYLRSRRDTEVYAVALAVGTIIKELDNGNTKHVTGPAVAELMNWLIS